MLYVHLTTSDEGGEAGERFARAGYVAHDHSSATEVEAEVGLRLVASARLSLVLAGLVCGRVGDSGKS